jgi:hypothetical protein
LVLLFPIVYNVLLFNSSYHIGETLIQIDKFLFVVLVFFYLNELFDRFGPIVYKWIKKVITINLVVLLVNLFLGSLGLGYKQYKVVGGGIGTRGFFYAGNEMAGLLLVLFTISLFLTYKNSSKGRYYFLSLIYLMFAILSSTKVAIIGIIISILIIPKLDMKLNFKEYLKINPNRFLKRFLLVLSLLSIVLFAIINSGLWDRWEFFYNNTFSNGIFSFILSGRDIEARKQIISFYENNSFLYWIIGIGANDSRIVEMDFIDILINYGLYGIITFYGFFLIVLTRIYKNAKQNIGLFSNLALYLIVLLFFVSTFTGHIIFSAMAGVYIGILSSLGLYISKVS